MGDKTDGMADKVLKEARFAVEDIRQKVVEKGWTGEVQTSRSIWHVPGLEKAASEKEVEASDLYGRDVEQPERSVWHVPGLDPKAEHETNIDDGREPMRDYDRDIDDDMDR